MKNTGFTFRKRLSSFKYAFQGVKRLFSCEPNAWIHFTIAVLVVIAGLFLSLSVMEWIIIVLLFGIVFAAEAFNSSIECLSDAVTPEYNEHIKHTKDLAAAAVLLVSIAAAIIGLIIFIPKIIVLF